MLCYPVWFGNKTPTYQADMEFHLTAIKDNPAYGALRVRAIKRKHVKAIYNEQLATTSQFVANKRLIFLVRAENYAIALICSIGADGK
jgi:hypothetical protein